jgi:hypothetical protein
MAELRAPEQNRLLGQLARMLRTTEGDIAAPEFLPKGLDVMGLVRQLMLPSAETVEKMSYGDPLFRMPTQSNIPITADREYLADIAGMIPLGAPAVSQIAREIATTAPEGAIRLSRAENEALGLYHPIGGGVKLGRPVSEMTAVTEPTPRAALVEREIMPLEGLLGGRIIPLVGDRAAAGRVLRSVDDVDLERPVILQGGPDFMRMQRFENPEESAAWASGKGVVSGLSRRVREASQEGDVYGMYTAMSPTGVDYNTMLTDTILGQLPNAKITKKLKKEFDKEVKKIDPDFVGVDSPDLEMQLLNNAPLRKVFVNRMELEKFRSGGFPDVAAARKAITEPELLDVPVGSSGYTISRLDPMGRIVESPRIPHKTYDTQLMGQYVGGLEEQIPREVMFADFFADRRARGMPLSGDEYAFQRSNVLQDATPQWLDSVMNYLRSVQR